MRKVALIGRAPQTRHYIPDIPDDVEIWIIAAVHNLEELPREPDVCVDMHRVEILKMKEYYQHHTLEMWEYLQEPHDYPIYMQEVYPEVPAARQYPIAGVVTMGHRVRRGEKTNEYLTSSFDWLLALAIYKRVDEIYLYGWDMGSETEYRYQREGASFWIGFAAGCGITVHIPPESSLVRTTAVYALERAQAITEEEINDLLKPIANKLNLFEAEHGTTFHGNDDEWEDYLRHHGAMRLLVELLDNHLISGWVARQRLEEHNSHIMRQYFTLQSVSNTVRGKVIEKRDRLKDNGTSEAQAEFHRELDQLHSMMQEYYAIEGAAKMIQHLIEVIDLQASLNDWKLEGMSSPVVVRDVENVANS